MRRLVGLGGPGARQPRKRLTHPVVASGVAPTNCHFRACLTGVDHREERPVDFEVTAMRPGPDRKLFQRSEVPDRTAGSRQDRRQLAF
jgi:hypothetical protein